MLFGNAARCVKACFWGLHVAGTPGPASFPRGCLVSVPPRMGALGAFPTALCGLRLWAPREDGGRINS